MTEGPEWQVIWTPEGRRSLTHVPPRILPAIISFVSEKLTADPWHVSHTLNAPLDGYRSGRVGSYHVLVRIDAQKKAAYVVKAAYHADVYR